MAITNGSLLNSTPSVKQQTLATNYLDFTGTTDNTWAQQYLPDLMEQEAEVFGPRTISGFLSQVGAEEAMTSDQVVWSEQGRLHLSYTATMTDNNGNINGSLNGGKITITDHIDTNAAYTSGSHGIRVNDTVIVSNSEAVIKALVTEVDGNVVELAPYGAADCSAITDAKTDLVVLVYGSEYAKGKKYLSAAAAEADSRGANEPSFNTFSNKPIIMKDYYEVSGSDASRIGWVEISAENGQSGYLWYLKAEADTRARFTDYIEMAMLEGELGVHGTDAVDNFLGSAGDSTGTQGLFAAIESRGNVTTGVTGVNASTD
jgi:hypothetical protein